MISALQRASPVLGRLSARPVWMMGRSAVRTNSCLVTTQHLPASTGACTHSDPSASLLAVAAPSVGVCQRTLNLQSLIRSATSPLSSLPASLTTVLEDVMVSLLGSPSILLIKRTFQPSILRKRRKHGFLQRQKSVGGRRVLKRRLQKGRARLGGC